MKKESSLRNVVFWIKDRTKENIQNSDSQYLSALYL
jgi:hypothetical protein